MGVDAGTQRPNGCFKGCADEYYTFSGKNDEIIIK